jgi:hypothetical protein
MATRIHAEGIEGAPNMLDVPIAYGFLVRLVVMPELHRAW